MQKRSISLLTALCLTLTLAPVGLAADGDAGAATPPSQTAGYDNAKLPAAPSVNGETITVDPNNAQYTLDGAYGEINGKTIVFSAGDYGQLELGRATKYPGSTTEYYIGGIASDKRFSYDEFFTKKTDTAWTASAYYVRNMSDVTLKAESPGTVKIAGLVGRGGHIHGTESATSYDYVLETSTNSTVNSYYLAQNWNNITFEDLSFTAQVNIASSQPETEIHGVSFQNCAFTTGGITSADKAALRYYNEINDGHISDLTVDGCTFDTCYQGIYTSNIKNVAVKSSHFTNTGHNAIAIQSGNAVNHGAVVITGNIFTDIQDRIIRLNNVGTDTQITITDNTATNSGDAAGEVIKASSLADGITYNIHSNSWGEGKTVVNSELKDQLIVAEIGGTKYASLEKAIAAAEDGATVTLIADEVSVDERIDISGGKKVKLNLNEKTLTSNGNLFRVVAGEMTVTGKGTIAVDGEAFRLDGRTSTAKLVIGADVEVDSKNDCCVFYYGPNAVVDVYGKLTSHGMYATLMGNGSPEYSGTTTNIYDGASVVSEETQAIYHPQNGTITIGKATISGQTVGIEMRAGSLTVDGAAITSTSDTFSCDPNGSGSTTVGAAIAIAQHTTKQDISVTIKGGTFTGVMALNESNPQENDPAPQVALSITGGEFYGGVEITDKPADGFISGGTFSTDPTVYVAQGYTAVQGADGRYTVVRSVTNVTLEQETLSMIQGGTTTLTATVTPENATNKTVAWASSDETVATVDETGKVTAVAAGTATITATTTDGGKAATCVVTVTAKAADDEVIIVPSVQASEVDEEALDQMELSDAQKAEIKTVARSVAADDTLTEAAEEQAADLGSSEAEKQEMLKTAEKALNIPAPPEGGEKPTINLYTQTYLDIKPQAVTKAEGEDKLDSITLDITPMVQVVASTASTPKDIELTGTNQNAVVVKSAEALKITKPAEITVTLPSDFADQTVYIKHTAETGTYFYTATATGTTLTFTSQHGFSPFSFSLQNDAVAQVGEIGYATFQDAVNAADDGETVKVLKDENLTAQVSGSSRTIKIKNATEAEIKVTLNGKEMTVAKDELQEYKYTRPSSGGGGGGGSTPSYSVALPSKVENGTVTVSPKSAVKGSTVTITATPDEGYELARLTVTDAKGNALELTDKGEGKYTFTMPSSKVEIEVAFAQAPVQTDAPCDGGEGCPAHRFADVSGEDWYHEAVDYMVTRGLMNGISDTAFAPDAPTTRAMLVSVLYRLENTPTVAEPANFNDVPAGWYYTDAVAWASANGIVTGYGNGSFGPNDTLTREQMAAIIYRYAAYKGYDVSARADLSGYTDAAQISGYAVEAMAWINAEEIITGTSATTLSPAGDAIRCQFAVILMRFCESLTK